MLLCHLHHRLCAPPLVSFSIITRLSACRSGSGRDWGAQQCVWSINLAAKFPHISIQTGICGMWRTNKPAFWRLYLLTHRSSRLCCWHLGVRYHRSSGVCAFFNKKRGPALEWTGCAGVPPDQRRRQSSLHLRSFLFSLLPLATGQFIYINLQIFFF